MMDLSRVRKAVVAGLAAGGTALVSSVLADPPNTGEGWTALVLAALGVGAGVGWATWRVPNANTINGSDPPVVEGFHG